MSPRSAKGVAREVGRTARWLPMLARLSRDLPAFLRTPLSTARAVELARDRVARREPRFLRSAELLIYKHERSPYLALLRSAGCEPGDLKALVRSEGIEGALDVLAAKGVYVTFDELKGRQAVVRGSVRFQFADEEFDNPRLRPHFQLLTGGSRGAPTTVPRSLTSIDEIAVSLAAVYDAHGLRRPGHAFWAVGPLTWMLAYAKLGHAIEGWFYPIHPLPLIARVGSRYLAALGRLGGIALPRTTFCDLRSPIPLLSWLAKRDHAGAPLSLMAFSSSAVRICAAAAEAGISLDGIVFSLTGEPYTAARARVLALAGASSIVHYSSMEMPMIASSCATPAAVDDVHLLADRYALTRRARPIGEQGPTVDALALTSISPLSPKVLLNAETGDCASVETRDCGCALGALGMRTHLAEVRSFEKLTGEGMTFVRSNLERILEESLPDQFGGTSSDYQLVEHEAPDGLARLVLRVAPSVGVIDEAALRSALFRALEREGDLERYMSSFWQRAQTLVIERKPPIVTRAGKVLPFHLSRIEANSSRG